MEQRWTWIFVVLTVVTFFSQCWQLNDSNEENSLAGVTVTITTPSPSPTIVATLSPTPSPIPTPSPVPLSPEFMQLRDKLSTEIIQVRKPESGIDIAMAVTDLQSGQTIEVNGMHSHITGCVINLFAFLTVVGEFEAGRASPVGLEDLISKGINQSSPPQVRNFLTAVFGDYSLGLAKSREFVASQGLAGTTFDHVPYYGGEKPSPNLTTALETNDILTRLWRRELYSPEWTSYALYVLGSGARYLDVVLPAGLPVDYQIAHKVGWFSDSTGWVENDVGIVSFTGDDGTEKAYAISFLSQYGPGGAYAESVGSTLSRLVWDYFDTTY